MAAAGKWNAAEQLAGEDASARALVRGLRDAAATVAADANGAGWSEWAAGCRRGARGGDGASIGGGAAAASTAAEDPDSVSITRPSAVRLEPRAVAKLLTAVGLDVDDLTAHRARAEHGIVVFVGACLGRASSDPSSAVAAATIAKHFSLVQFATPSALDAWEAQGHGPVADGIAATLTESRRRSYAAALRDKHPSGASGRDGTSPADRADRYFRRLGLPPAFPEEERAGREGCLLYTSPSPRDQRGSRMPSSA